MASDARRGGVLYPWLEFWQPSGTRAARAGALRGRSGRPLRGLTRLDSQLLFLPGHQQVESISASDRPGKVRTAEQRVALGPTPAVAGDNLACGQKGVARIRGGHVCGRGYAGCCCWPHADQVCERRRQAHVPGRSATYGNSVDGRGCVSISAVRVRWLLGGFQARMMKGALPRSPQHIWTTQAPRGRLAGRHIVGPVWCRSGGMRWRCG